MVTLYTSDPMADYYFVPVSACGNYCQIFRDKNSRLISNDSMDKKVYAHDSERKYSAEDELEELKKRFYRLQNYARNLKLKLEVYEARELVGSFSSVIEREKREKLKEKIVLDSTHW